MPSGIEVPPWFDVRFHIYPTDLAALLLFGIFLYCCRIPLRRLLEETRGKWLIAFLGIALLSVLFSPFSHCPVAYQRLLQLLTPFLLFFALSEQGADWMKPVMWCFVISSLLQAGLAIEQYFYFTDASLYSFRPTSNPEFIGGIPCAGARWIIDEWLGIHIDRPYLLRGAGTMIHANPLGAFLNVSIFSCFALYCVSSRRARIFLGFSLSIFIFALLITFSRSALFGGILASLFFFCRQPRPKLLIFLSVCFLILGFGLLHKQILLRGGILNQNGLAKDSNAIRTSQNRVALKVILDHPILGVGYQQYTLNRQYNDWSQPYSLTMVHNSPLLIAAEMGLPAFLLLLVFFFSVLRLGWKFAADPLAAASIAVLIQYLFISGSDFYPFIHQHAKMALFLLLGLFFSRIRTLPLAAQEQTLLTLYPSK